jgi:NAD(P)-dependent dehydrogenase (short-subunit alcohol dehydrogenase family)
LRASLLINLEGKGAIIVGARRIGAIVASRMAADGINVAVVYRNSKAEAEALVNDLLLKKVNAITIKCDLTNEDQVLNMLHGAKKELGTIDFGVNLASGFPRDPFMKLNSDSWDNSIGDAKGTFLFGVHLAREMMSNPGPTKGHLVFFSDWAAIHSPYKNYLPYMASKASIDFMTRAFAVELSDSGILVNAIAPGPTMRPPDISESSWNKNVVSKSPLKRESSASDIGEMVVTLLKSETITGETIRIDSGRHLAGPGSN